jgi:formylglycine-generating enzyme required for sulfatase activity
MKMDNIDANRIDDDTRSGDEFGRIRVPNLISIPGGEFLMGTSEDDVKHLQLKESGWAYEWADNNLFSNEKPQHVVKLSDFKIAQFPVSNEEYYLFVWGCGYPLPKGWQGFSFPKEEGNHPVTGISKKDAEEYIGWLSSKAGIKFRLPSEAEWEKAARGSDGRIYPWGNSFDPWRCNTSESMKKGTTPVGFYSPGGDSIYGVADMVGNVWEWTSTIQKPYPYRQDDGREKKDPNALYVIRGGAWYYSRKLARCSCREGMSADQTSDSIGFRLTCDD